MIETQKNWSPDWADRIAGAIQSLGFASLTEFLASMPARPYGEIAGHLGKVVPIQVSPLLSVTVQPSNSIPLKLYLSDVYAAELA